MSPEDFALALAGKTAAQIRKAVEDQLKQRCEACFGLYTTAGKPKQIALREQATFLAGALTALAAVFGNDGDKDFKAPISGIALYWTLCITRGEFVFDDKS